MPGHVAKSDGPDPDPTEYLFISAEMRNMDLEKPYDAKKDCWVPNEREGFILGKIEEVEDDMISVLADGETKEWKKDTVHQVNPPKYEKSEDMSNLTFLNDPSVLWNLKDRYVNKLIYTYSGLFCIAVNPYKRFPIYTDRAAKIYIGKRRNEVPPHIFAISDNAYSAMMLNHQNQSMLITGESGAGKTENTKKVIAYFGSVAANNKKKGDDKKRSRANRDRKVNKFGYANNLEDQIVQTNPILEAWGNAKTVRNDNSSRFGKFIRIHFQANGKLSGADIENYLLEKARVISQMSLERSYHIFYNIMTGVIPGQKEMCKLSADIYDYHYVSQGKVTVASIDDGEDMNFAHEAFTILNFSDNERDNVYKITATVMHFGNMKFKQRGREEQAETDGTESPTDEMFGDEPDVEAVCDLESQCAGEIISELFGIEAEMFFVNLCKPKIKVGAELITKGQTEERVHYSVGALAKSIYDRVFKFLFKKCNETLETGLKRIHFIGVLDIAGFEIFESNGFEQLCINFTNEKLQQFFNHHMFVLEQEEYKREGIDWTFVDFGMDLQACIDLFEKPMGVLAILEEESMFPKATDKTFEDKLNVNLLGNSQAFIKPRGNAHFGICHYAGTVFYTVTGWLEKNKDPLNDTVIDQLKKAENQILVGLFHDHPGQSEDPSEKAGGKKTKSSGFRTVSSGYREQLNSLMATLTATQPHFIRCIVPNETKSPGVIDAALIMHQLTCNGVLEGIRICRKGFPNRIAYADFKHRYKILAAQELTHNPDNKEAATACFEKVGLDAEKWRVGHTKVFFRAGVLGELEEFRDEALGRAVGFLQAWVRGYQARQKFQKMKEQREMLLIVQRALRRYMKLCNWPWYQLWQQVKPLLNVSRVEDEMKALAEKADTAEKQLQEQIAKTKALEAQNLTLMNQRNDLQHTLESTKSGFSGFVEKEKKLVAKTKELETQLEERIERLTAEEEARNVLFQAKQKVELDVKNMRSSLEDFELNVQRGEQDKATKDHQIRNLMEETSHQDELINKLQKEKKHLQEANQKTAEDLQSVEDKCNHLSMLKSKLEQTLDELEDSLDRERKLRAEVEMQKRKISSDLKLTQDAVGDVEREKKELENIILRNEKDISQYQAKIDDQSCQISKLQRQIKEQHTVIEEFESDLQREKEARAKTEKSKQRMAKDLSEMSDRLDEAGGATAGQIELNKKRESELAKLRRDLEEHSIQHEAAIVSFRKKHNDSVAELAEQIDHLNKIKVRVEKDRDVVKKEADDARAALDQIMKEKVMAEKIIKDNQRHMDDLQGRMDEANRTLNDFDVAKKKLTCENGDLLRQLEESENKNSLLSKNKLSLENQLTDTKKLADEECRERGMLLAKYRHLEEDFHRLRERLDEESEAKADVNRQLNRAMAEAQMYRTKYESEGIARAEELEAARLKLAGRLENAEQQVEQLNIKNLNLEKIKQRLCATIDGLQHEVEEATNIATAAEKRQKHFDHIIGEWKNKVDDISMELDGSQKECRNYASELFKVKAAYEENVEQLEQVRRESKTLSEEVKDLNQQLAEGVRNMHDLATNAKRHEHEKEEFQCALEEAEAALEQEENKVLRGKLELTNFKKEIDVRMKEKDEEFENARICSQRAIDSIQASLEAESRTKNEALSYKKRLENSINELELSIEHSNKANIDLQKYLKKTQDELKDTQDRIIEEQQIAAEYREQYGIAERRANALHGELDESRSLLEQSDRGRRQAETELTEAHEQVTDLSSQNAGLQTMKRKLEGEISNLHADLDEMLNEVKMADERAKKSMTDAARLAEELRAENEHAQSLDKSKKNLELQVKDLEARLREVESEALRTGKLAVSKLEHKVHELTQQLESETNHHGEAQKNLRKCERRIKELTLQSEEEKRTHSKMQDLVDQLQVKIKQYKRQIEEAEEIAALNLAKYRKAQQECEETQEIADLTGLRRSGMTSQMAIESSHIIA